MICNLAKKLESVQIWSFTCLKESSTLTWSVPICYSRLSSLSQVLMFASQIITSLKWNLGSWILWMATLVESFTLFCKTLRWFVVIIKTPSSSARLILDHGMTPMTLKWKKLWSTRLICTNDGLNLQIRIRFPLLFTLQAKSGRINMLLMSWD